MREIAVVEDTAFTCRLALTAACSHTLPRCVGSATATTFHLRPNGLGKSYWHAPSVKGPTGVTSPSPGVRFSDLAYRTWYRVRAVNEDLGAHLRGAGHRDGSAAASSDRQSSPTQ